MDDHRIECPGCYGTGDTQNNGAPWCDFDAGWIRDAHAARGGPVQPDEAIRRAAAWEYTRTGEQRKCPLCQGYKTVTKGEAAQWLINR